ncbi:MAG: serine/threonine-protein kinase [Kofleriaceae bacterium]
MERQFGPYRLVRQVAVGGMAEIHLAKTKGIAGFEKYVALKMIHPNFAEDEQFIEMLVDEAKIAVQLTHHNIAQTFDLGRVGDTYYISMEYVDGADLYKMLRRSSEQDVEFPLDICAFIAKEVALGLDYAHRKRDVTGQQLGIVHRDVSPQNVLVSYAGEVKLVDFGIAKATMKVKQTAAGVIKGKYYYMSPEQASGGHVDARSDIFSVGIVLYEMITGQMLYLEEDLYRLLDMVRRADIAPPSKLRRGIPPQLERIVMHALAKTPAERYQSGGDMASDLERFLHAYSPVFTPAKVVTLLRQAVGDTTLAMEQAQTQDAIEVLDDSKLMRAPGELRDSNSVIFRVPQRPLDDFDHIDTDAVTDGGLDGPRPLTAPKREPARTLERPATRPPAPPRKAERPGTRPPAPPTASKVRAATAPIVPSERAEPAPPPRPPPRPLPAVGTARTVTKRGVFDETRELPNDFQEDGAPQTGLMDPPTNQESAQPVASMPLYGLEDLEGGDSTMVSSIPNFYTETGEIENTMVQRQAPVPEHTDYGETVIRSQPIKDEAPAAAPASSRALTHDLRPRAIGAPAALAARNPSPAVSELRRPRPSRSTPPVGVANVLQALVAAPGSEPMPAPPRASASAAAAPSTATPSPTAPAPTAPAAAGAFEATVTAPHTYVPSVSPQQAGVPPYQPPPAPAYASQAPLQYALQQAAPQGAPPAYGYLSAQFTPQAAGSAPLQAHAPYAGGHPYPNGYPRMESSPLPFPQGGAPATATGRLRALEVDEIPEHYRIKRDGPRWFVLLAIAVTAVAAAASVTFMILRADSQQTAASASLRLESIPAGASVIIDGKRLAEPTPTTYRLVKPSGHYNVRLELARHKPYLAEVTIRAEGGETTLNANLQQITGTLRVISDPPGVDVFINNATLPRGKTPLVVRELDMENTKTLELRRPRYDPILQELTWPESGELNLEFKLTPAP